jgi:hypothetical protein
MYAQERPTAAAWALGRRRHPASTLAGRGRLPAPAPPWFLGGGRGNLSWPAATDVWRRPPPAQPGPVGGNLGEHLAILHWRAVHAMPQARRPNARAVTTHLEDHAHAATIDRGHHTGQAAPACGHPAAPGGRSGSHGRVERHPLTNQGLPRASAEGRRLSRRFHPQYFVTRTGVT